MSPTNALLISVTVAHPITHACTVSIKQTVCNSTPTVGFHNCCQSCLTWTGGHSSGRVGLGVIHLSQVSPPTHLLHAAHTTLLYILSPLRGSLRPSLRLPPFFPASSPLNISLLLPSFLTPIFSHNYAACCKPRSFYPSPPLHFKTSFSLSFYVSLPLSLSHLLSLFLGARRVVKHGHIVNIGLNKVCMGH